MPTNRTHRCVISIVVTVIVQSTLTLGADPPAATRYEPSPDLQAALDRVSADSLKGHLSFLASDLLEGRDTPSRGLDLAAAYIAAQFRRAGLEPIGDDGYYQTANWRVAETNPEGITLELRFGEQSIQPARDSLSLSRDGKLELTDAKLFKLDKFDEESLQAIKDEQLLGRAVVVALRDPAQVERGKQAEVRSERNRVLGRLGQAKAVLVLNVDRSPENESKPTRSRLIDPENRSRFQFPRGGSSFLPVLSVREPATVKRLEDLPAGPSDSTVSLKVGDPVEKPVALRNVVGLLRGSDPELKDTYVLVTAHYDHIGIGTPVKGDRIYNGANDDGSGTVSVVEIASALGSLKNRPKRSILFMTFFGEEKGLLGSRYYGAHPLVPVEKTVADVNLEQVGRTDSTEGPNVASASMTGFDFSDVGPIFQAAGEREGIKVYKHPRNSDAFFGRSDNQALADLGVPAHTICVSYVYSDYHGAEDHWEKVDYVNMAKIDRAVALGLMMIADTSDAPRWNPDNTKAARYLKAWQKLHGDK
jgi:hypothetical protein